MSAFIIRASLPLTEEGFDQDMATMRLERDIKPHVDYDYLVDSGEVGEMQRRIINVLIYYRCAAFDMPPPDSLSYGKYNKAMMTLMAQFADKAGYRNALRMNDAIYQKLEELSDACEMAHTGKSPSSESARDPRIQDSQRDNGGGKAIIGTPTTSPVNHRVWAYAALLLTAYLLFSQCARGK